MASLTDISGIDDEARQLFEAIDVSDSEDLAREDIGGLYARLYQANKDQQFLDPLPAIDQIEAWIEEARELAGGEADEADEADEKPKSTKLPPRGTPEPEPESEPEPSSPFGRATLLLGLDKDAWMEAYEQAPEATILETGPPPPRGGAAPPPPPAPRGGGGGGRPRAGGGAVSRIVASGACS
jgi:hypothetical protein